MRAVESLTTLCPRELCREKRAASARAVDGTASALLSDAGVVYLHLVVPEPYDERVPAVDDSWGNFGRNEHAEEAPRRGAAAQPCGRNVCELTRLDRPRPPADALLPAHPAAAHALRLPPVRAALRRRGTGPARARRRPLEGPRGRARQLPALPPPARLHRPGDRPDHAPAARDGRLRPRARDRDRRPRRQLPHGRAAAARDRRGTSRTSRSCRSS